MYISINNINKYYIEIMFNGIFSFKKLIFKALVTVSIVNNIFYLFSKQLNFNLETEKNNLKILNYFRQYFFIADSRTLKDFGKNWIFSIYLHIEAEE